MRTRKSAPLKGGVFLGFSMTWILLLVLAVIAGRDLDGDDSDTADVA